MGVKFSKAAVRPHVKAADTSVAPTSAHHTIDDTKSRQDPALDLPVCNTSERSVSHHLQLSHDDINVATSTSTAPTLDSPQRRNSVPAPSMSTGHRDHTQQCLALFEQFLVEHRLMSIDYEEGTAFQPPPPITQPAAPTAAPVEQCLICCLDVHKSSALKAIKPCLACNSVYCHLCIKKIFLDACKDMSRMPPRCCEPINLQQAKPYLTAEDIALFRSKYEEWRTPNPMYCPVPACSAFIPERLLPQHLRSKNKRRVDSGIGTPKSESFACPTCQAGICVDCRQQAHPGSMCTMNEFGLDEETAKLLKEWGYKKCPKCGHGVKRMFGCNHMECRCGAHFCWSCMANINECGGGCYDDDDEYEEEGDEYGDNGVAEPGDDGQDPATVQDTTDQAEPAMTAQTTIVERPRNLDAGTAQYWANTEFNFGDEPTDQPQAVWDCHHEFSVYLISLSTAFDSRTTAMECVRCWNTIHASINAPHASTNDKDKSTPANTTRATRFGVRGNRGNRGRGRGRGRGTYAPPRGLFRADATIGTAPHLTATIPVLSSSQPTRAMSPMEDVQFSHDTIARRASLDSSHQHATPTSNVFASTPKTFSLAFECISCNFLVCDKCRADLVSEQEEERRLREEEKEKERARQEESVRQAGTVTSQEITPVVGTPETAQVEDDDDDEVVCSIGFD
jgi:hypothetical protein